MKYANCYKDYAKGLFLWISSTMTTMNFFFGKLQALFIADSTPYFLTHPFGDFFIAKFCYPSQGGEVSSLKTKRDTRIFSAESIGRLVVSRIVHIGDFLPGTHNGHVR